MQLRSGKSYKFVSKPKPRARKARTVATKTLRKEIQRVVGKNAEKKYIDVTHPSNGAVDATAELFPAANPFAEIVQGDARSNRTGNDIRVKSMQYSFRVTALTNASTMVLYIVKFKECDGGVPVLADIWQSLTDIEIAHRLKEKLSDYTILKRIVVRANQGVLLNKTVKATIRFKGAGMLVRYDASTGADTDVEMNGVFCITQANAADDVITIGASQCRINYTDI